MRRFLMVGAMLGLATTARADDKIVVKDNKGTTIIINGPVIVNGNNNIVQIGSGNKVIVNNPRASQKGTKIPPSRVGSVSKSCDEQFQRHNNQVAAWMAMMGKR
jgi:hypothetical protein